MSCIKSRPSLLVKKKKKKKKFSKCQNMHIHHHRQHPPKICFFWLIKHPIPYYLVPWSPVFSLASGTATTCGNLPPPRGLFSRVPHSLNCISHRISPLVVHATNFTDSVVQRQLHRLAFAQFAGERLFLCPLRCFCLERVIVASCLFSFLCFPLLS